MPDWTIRAATTQDVETVARFNEAMALETEALTLDPARVRAGVARLVADAGLGHCFVACARDGRVVGTLGVTSEWSDWRCGSFWWIQSVYVAPEQRRGGVFAALYAHVEALARASEDVCGLRLYVEQDNERAMATYRQLGMHETHYRIYETEFPRA